MLLVTGPRQAGKSTMLERMMEPERKKVSLDSPTMRMMARMDPELFPCIKVLADRRKTPGDFWLTGSQMFRMMKNVTESMAGRVGIVPMLGLTNSELQGNHFPAFEIDIPTLTERRSAAEPIGIPGI